MVSGDTRKSTNLFLIRHGESTPQVERIMGGMRGDRGLTPLGVAQAERLRDRLTATREVTADVVIASTMPRARQTAEILAPALGLPIIEDEEVQEVRPGIADGLSLEEAEARFHMSAFVSDPSHPVSPGGESWQQFVQRVSGAFDRITQQHAGRTVVVVCHAGVIEGSFLHFFRLPLMSLPPVQFSTQNTSITHWQQPLDGASGRWRLFGYNDAMHLFKPAGKRIDWGSLVGDPGVGADRPAVPLPVNGDRSGAH
jgi:probable phosphoglycerate mutase